MNLEFMFLIRAFKSLIQGLGENKSNLNSINLLGFY